MSNNDLKHVRKALRKVNDSLRNPEMQLLPDHTLSERNKKEKFIKIQRNKGKNFGIESIDETDDSDSIMEVKTEETQTTMTIENEDESINSEIGIENKRS